MIDGAEDEEYRLSLDDVGSSMVFMYTPVTEENARGEPQYKYTEFVKAGKWKSFYTDSIFSLSQYVKNVVICVALLSSLSFFLTNDERSLWLLVFYSRFSL